MNAPFLICLVLCIGFGVEALRRRRLDRAAATEVQYGYGLKKPEPRLCWPCVDIYSIEAIRSEYHLLHEPNDGCGECVDK